MCFSGSVEGNGRGGIGEGVMGPSQLLQAAVHVSLAALPGPGATLQAELPQVLLEVLMVHGSVRLRLTLGLDGRKKNETSSRD